MFRVSLPRKAKEGLFKSKNEPLVREPVVVSRPSRKRVKRAAKEPGLSVGPGPDNNPNLVCVQNSDPEDTDFLPVSTSINDTGKQVYLDTLYL